MVKVKICGISDCEVLEQVIAKDVNYVGMIMAESRRKVSEDVLRQCAAKHSQYRQSYPNVEFVAVFLDQTLEEIVQIMEMFPFDILQLHGEETVGLCKKIKKLYPNVQIIKTLAIPDTIIDETLFNQQLQCKVSYYRKIVDSFLLDTHKGNQRGGTGTVFPWEIAQSLIGNRFRDYGVGIAGGLSIDNVEQLLAATRPDFLDINSGVEINGVKNIEKIDQLLAKLEESTYANL